MINLGAREKILAALELQPGETVWEIGPGLGAMTYMLLERGHPVVAFEIDPGYVKYLEDTFCPHYPLRLVYGDVVKTWKDEFQKLSAPVKVLGNLPYNAASAIIGDFVENGFRPPLFSITVQKEMAGRMTSNLGNKNYSSFSVLCQSAFDMITKGDLKPGSFFPPPEVTSTVLQLRAHQKYRVEDARFFSQLARQLFSSRRKTLRNNVGITASTLHVSEVFLKQVMEEVGVDLSARAETLAVEVYYKIYLGLKGALNPVESP